MLHLDATRLSALLNRRATIEALRTIFRDGCTVPQRQHHALGGDGPLGIVLIMPAWLSGRYLGVKTVTMFPENGANGLPSLHGLFTLFSAETGLPLATMDGGALTAHRTAAASALAADYLARPNAKTLLVVGTGRIARHLAACHAAIRPIETIVVWGRDRERAQAAMADIRAELPGHTIAFAADLEAAARSADIISCATLSPQPLVKGAWLKQGSHLDLVGSFTPDMRECDDEAMRRASIFVDTPAAMTEAGDLAIPLTSGILRPEAILADLAGLTRGTHTGRQGENEITLFKSVGAAQEDLAAAILAYETATGITRYPPPAHRDH